MKTVGAWPSPIDGEVLNRSSLTLSKIAIARSPKVNLKAKESCDKETFIYFTHLQGQIPDSNNDSKQFNSKSFQLSEVKYRTHSKDFTLKPFAISPSSANVTSPSKGYSATPYAVSIDNDLIVYFDFESRTVFKKDISKAPQLHLATPVVIAKSKPFGIYSEFDIHPSKKILIAVYENPDCDSSIVILDLVTKTKNQPHILESTKYTPKSPKWNLKGDLVAYIIHELPDKSGPASHLVVARFDFMTITFSSKFEIHADDRSLVTQPLWSPKYNDILYYLCDISGFSNLYVYNSKMQQTLLLLKKPLPSTFDYPDIYSSKQTYAIHHSGAFIVVSHLDKFGNQCFSKIELDSARRISIATPFTWISEVAGIMNVRSSDGAERDFVVLHAASLYSGTTGVWTYDLYTGAVDLLIGNEVIDFDPSYLSAPETILVPLKENMNVFDKERVLENVSNQSCDLEFISTYYYPPSNPKYKIINSKAPLLVQIHGGPDSMSQPIQSVWTSYWTSRGWAVIAPNYRGSYGFGRKFQDGLLGNLGILDMADIIKCVKFFIAKGVIDQNKVFLSGKSLGAFIVLNLLTCQVDSIRNTFKAGTSYFGPTDLLKYHDKGQFLVKKLESLVGVSITDKPSVYQDRSPIKYVDNLQAPLLLIHGDIDSIVDKNHSKVFYDKAKKRGKTVEYYEFEGEGHEITTAEARRKAIEIEYAFYLKHGIIGAESTLQSHTFT